MSCIPKKNKNRFSAVVLHFGGGEEWYFITWLNAFKHVAAPMIISLDFKLQTIIGMNIMTYKTYSIFYLARLVSCEFIIDTINSFSNSSTSFM